MSSTPTTDTTTAEVVWRARGEDPAHAFDVRPGRWMSSVCGRERWTVLHKPTDPRRCRACEEVLGL